MSTRISEWTAGVGLLCFTLAACGSVDRSPGSQSDASNGATGAADCAIGAKATWSRSCSAEQQGDLLTLRHANGGFRRFRIVKDGRGLVAADGGEPAVVSILGKGLLEIGVGDDRYRIPATIAPAGRQ